MQSTNQILQKQLKRLWKAYELLVVNAEGSQFSLAVIDQSYHIILGCVAGDGRRTIVLDLRLVDGRLEVFTFENGQLWKRLLLAVIELA